LQRWYPRLGSNRRIGNSVALIIDREIASAVGIDRTTTISSGVEGRGLVVEPLRPIVGAGDDGAGRGVAQRNELREKRESR